MPRPRLRRRVGFRPDVIYFKPTGVGTTQLKESIMTVDELEAVRLKDLLGLEQREAAKKMSVSQPTFNRMILSARKKIADAIVNGKAIKIEGGVYVMPRRGYGGPAYCVCPVCGHKEQHIRGTPCARMKCKKCGASMVRSD